MLQIQPLLAATLKDIITKSSNSLQTQDFNGTNNNNIQERDKSNCGRQTKKNKFRGKQ